MRDLLIRLARMGKTLIVTSHILPELSRICDRIAILTHGKLRAQGTVEEISRMVSQERTIEAQLTSAEQLPRRRILFAAASEKDTEVTQVPAEAVLRFRTARTEAELSELLADLIKQGVRVSSSARCKPTWKRHSCPLPGRRNRKRPPAPLASTAPAGTATAAGGAHG